uniref:Uncharacterized protein n=1 Tax=Castor canadensis TaxID=51338 RepID=A0A8C0WZ25_CASCN
MEVHGELTANSSCFSSTQDCSGVSVSKELLTAGSEGRGGIWDRENIRFLKTSTFQTVQIERGHC